MKMNRNDLFNVIMALVFVFIVGAAIGAHSARVKPNLVEVRLERVEDGVATIEIYQPETETLRYQDFKLPETGKPETLELTIDDVGEYNMVVLAYQPEIDREDAYEVEIPQWLRAVLADAVEK
jgi:hypothetical protein